MKVIMVSLILTLKLLNFEDWFQKKVYNWALFEAVIKVLRESYVDSDTVTDTP